MRDTQFGGAAVTIWVADYFESIASSGHVGYTAPIPGKDLGREGLANHANLAAVAGVPGSLTVISVSMRSPYKNMAVRKPEYCSEYPLSTPATAARLAWPLALLAHTRETNVDVKLVAS